MSSLVRLCGVNDVAADSAHRIDVAGLRLAVVHIGDDWYAIADRCSHADESLSEGDVWPDERELECPKHGSTFSLLTGEPQTLPATRSVPVYEVRVEGDDVMLVVSADADADADADAEAGAL
jgi:3-phenylpropionate/trans-cinnamate dioxygenase ferredoxin subunit